MFIQNFKSCKFKDEVPLPSCLLASRGGAGSKKEKIPLTDRNGKSTS